MYFHLGKVVDHEAAESVPRLALLVHKEGGMGQSPGQEAYQPRRLLLCQVGQHALYATPAIFNKYRTDCCKIDPGFYSRGGFLRHSVGSEKSDFQLRT